MLIFNMYRMISLRKFISIVCFLYFNEAKLKPETKKSDEFLGTTCTPFEENKTSISTKIERISTQFSLCILLYMLRTD